MSAATSRSSPGNAASEVINSRGAPAALATGDSIALTVWMEPAGIFTLNEIVYLANHGSIPITIDRVESPFGGLRDAGHLDIRFSSGQFGDSGAKFHAFTLGAHQTVLVSIHQDATCQSSVGSALGWQGVKVQTSLFGYHRWVEIATQPFALQVRRSCRPAIG